MAADRRALADPRFLVAVALLAANDHWWKAAHGSWLTGKLSDVVGLLVVGVMLRVALVDARRGRLALGALAVAFAALKAVPAATALAVDAADVALPWSNAVVTDPTDLLAVPVLFAVAPIVERPIVWWTSRSVRVLGLLAAATAAVATSSPPTEGADLSIESDRIVATPFNYDPDADYAASACRPSTPDECFRIRDLRIDESVDGGASWTTVWRVDHNAAATLRSEHTSAYEASEFGPRDIVATDTQVKASFDGLDTVVERQADGTWTPTPRDFRALPRAAIGLQAVVVVLVATAFAAIAVRIRRDLRGGPLLGVLTLGSLVLSLVILLGAMRSSVGLLPLEIFLAVPIFALLIISGLALMEPTRLWRSLVPGARVALGAVLLAGLVLPPIPLLRWSATNSPGYRAATLLSITIAGLAALAPLLIGYVGTRRPTIDDPGARAPGSS
ncbi:MAG: hypothetical protein DHS20C19_05910 [Acidimicrobiales bacterium]|nr:MAG: hypothetical protein DHS20C19_05910 [Acidimicrobiales bacterium]